MKDMVTAPAVVTVAQLGGRHRGRATIFSSPGLQLANGVGGSSSSSSSEEETSLSQSVEHAVGLDLLNRWGG